MTWSLGHVSIFLYSIPKYFTTTHISMYVWGKVFDGGRKVSTNNQQKKLMENWNYRPIY